MTDRRGRDTARVARWCLALMLAGALGGCSPSPSLPPTSTSSPPPTSTSSVPSEPPTASPVPTPGTSAAAAATPCEPADLGASHGLVEGAAGSRLTTVVLVSALACSIDAFPAIGLRDAQGAILIGAAAGGPGRLELVPGTRYESNVRLANWCSGPPAFPLALEIGMAGEALAVTGSSFPDDGDLPPCTGTGGPILEASQWVAAP